MLLAICTCGSLGSREDKRIHEIPLASGIAVCRFDYVLQGVVALTAMLHRCCGKVKGDVLRR